MNNTKFFWSICSLVIFNALGANYFGQNGLDQYLNEEVFKNKTTGVFFDIGAYDGITTSNTVFFEKSLGWTGVCVEPLPGVYKKLTQNRACVCIFGAMAATSGRREFTQAYGPNQLEMLSGFTNTFYRERMDKINHEDMHGAGWRIIMVPTYTFSGTCVKNGLTHIDYLSLSTAGSEEEIIKSIDLATIDITVISVDNPYPLFRPALGSYLASKGYVFTKRLGTVDIYLKN